MTVRRAAVWRPIVAWAIGLGLALLGLSPASAALATPANPTTAAPAAPAVPSATDPVEAALAHAERQQQEMIQLIARLSPTVVNIFRVSEKNNELANGSGSGVIISPDGYALTNYHVTESSRELRVGMAGGKVFKARLCGVDHTADIALIQIQTDQPLPYAALGSSSRLEIGQWVVAIGNPFMLAADFQPTVSLGIVSGLHRYLPGRGPLGRDLVYADAIQIDAALNPGNSGGPLFTLQGELVGINGRIAPRLVQGMRAVAINAGIGFAIPIDVITPFLADLKAGHKIDRGYIGVNDADPVADGLKIVRIAPDSPAEIFGLLAGDVILLVDGRPVRNEGEFYNYTTTRAAGARVKLAIRRGRETLERTVQLSGIQALTSLKMAEIENRGNRDLLSTDEDEDEDETPETPAPGPDDKNRKKPPAEDKKGQP